MACDCEIYEVCRECVGDEEFERISRQNDETLRRMREEEGGNGNSIAG